MAMPLMPEPLLDPVLQAFWVQINGAHIEGIPVIADLLQERDDQRGVKLLVALELWRHQVRACLGRLKERRRTGAGQVFMDPVSFRDTSQRALAGCHAELATWACWLLVGRDPEGVLERPGDYWWGIYGRGYGLLKHYFAGELEELGL